jgi:ubiquinone/menaquinone biosynthesis C-methylase UbiE
MESTDDVANRVLPGYSAGWTHFPERQHSVDYQSTNRVAWNHLADSNSQFTRCPTDKELAQPLKALDGRGWLPDDLTGKDVLCLASGGGWQSTLYAAARANVTVVDISDAMLRLDQREAENRGYRMRLIRASMDDLSELGDATFDVVHQPVSTCYVPDICAVHREVARVLRDGGVYISQHKQPTSLQISHRNDRQQFVIGIEYYHDGPLPRQQDESYRETGATEYLHRWEDLVGGMCRAGMVIEDFCEPKRADPRVDVTHYGYRGRFVPPYVRIKARRLPRSQQHRPNTDSASESRIWMPGTR